MLRQSDLPPTDISLTTLCGKTHFAGYRIMRTLYPVLKLIHPNGVVTSEDLARTIYKCGLHGGPLKILENRDIREYSMRQINEI